MIKQLIITAMASLPAFTGLQAQSDVYTHRRISAARVATT